MFYLKNNLNSTSTMKLIFKYNKYYLFIFYGLYIFGTKIIEMNLFEENNKPLELTPGEKQEIFEKLHQNPELLTILSSNNYSNKDQVKTVINQLYKFIPGTFNLYHMYANYGQYAPHSLHKIQSVSVYKDNNQYFDFFKTIQFKKKGDNHYEDIHGNLIGRKAYISRDELLLHSKLSDIGLMVEKDISDETLYINKINMKKLVAEILINKYKIIDSKDLLQKYHGLNLTTNLLTSIIQFNLSPNHPDDHVFVCLCKNRNCNTSCDEIYKMYRRDLYHLTP